MIAGIIGLGVIATVHVVYLLEQGVTVKAVCDIDYDKAVAFNKEYGLNATIYTDYREMAKDNDIQVFHVCTPHYLHKRMVVDLEILSAEKLSKGKLGVCHQNRFNDASIKLKELTANQKIKVCTTVVPWGRDKSYYQASDWRGKWATEGGSLLINQALHTLDLACNQRE